jgi:hypothetical protein
MALVAKDFREQLPDPHFIVNYEYVRHLVMPLLSDSRLSLRRMPENRRRLDVVPGFPYSQDSMRDSRFGQVRLWR